MAKVLNLISPDMQNKRPASSTADVPVPKRPTISRMPIHQEGRSPPVLVCNLLYLLLILHLYRLA